MTVSKLGPSSGEAAATAVAETAGFGNDLTKKKISDFDDMTTSHGISSSIKTPTSTTTTTSRTTSSKTSDSSNVEGDKKGTLSEWAEDDAIKKPIRKLGPKMNPVYKTVRAFVWATYFVLGATLISMTQVMAIPLSILAPGVYRRHMKRTTVYFGALMLKMNELFAPSDIILTGDESIREIVKVYQGKRIHHHQHQKSTSDCNGNENKDDGNEKYHPDETLLDLPDRLIFVANHQIYSDWIYLWCFAHLAKKDRGIKIILRGDLTWIPVFGWGMRFFDFIFLKRNDWAHDKKAIESNLERLRKDDPLWLLVYPEGTVVSRGTRKRSSAFAQKAGLKDHRHVLLPRTSGMFVCLNKLRGSVEYVYDAAVGYSGVHYGEIPQELYPLPGLYVDKAQPREINIHLRRFAVKDIPESEPEFVEWLRARWQEKDDLMEKFYTTGKFPSQLTAEDIGINSKEDQKGQSIRIPLKTNAGYSLPTLIVLALPVLALVIRYVLQHTS